MTAPPLRLESRADYIHFVEILYFDAVRRADHQTLLGYFAPGATLTGYFGNAAGFVATREPAPGQRSLDDFMKAATEFDLDYSDFVHFADPPGERIASHFSLVMTPKPSGTMTHLPVRRLRNCNFFQFQGGFITEIVAYFAQALG